MIFKEILPYLKDIWDSLPLICQFPLAFFIMVIAIEMVFGFFTRRSSDDNEQENPLIIVGLFIALGSLLLGTYKAEDKLRDIAYLPKKENK